MRARIREITALETAPDSRNQGHARDLMQRICISADLSDTWLMVHVEPGDDLTDMQRLASFYASLGFEPFQASPLMMIRRSVQGRMTGEAPPVAKVKRPVEWGAEHG